MGYAQNYQDDDVFFMSGTSAPIELRGAPYILFTQTFYKTKYSMRIIIERMGMEVEMRGWGRV